jgi:diguanylate cyclase (GGDEF)-like protein
LAIQNISAVIKNVFRKTDIIARFSSNQFSIILPETAYNNVLMISKRFQKNVQQLWINIPESSIQVKLGVSIGIALFPGDGTDPETLEKRAEAALNNAKAVSQNKIVFAKDI